MQTGLSGSWSDPCRYGSADQGCPRDKRAELRAGLGRETKGDRCPPLELPEPGQAPEPPPECRGRSVTY